MTLNSKILIVDDEIIVAIDIKKRLEDLNYNVVGIVGNGLEAIKKTEELNPDIVLMDISLKGDLDGIETAEKIQDLYNIPFIYLTGSSNKEIFELTKKSQLQGYLEKPFDITELHTLIQSIINNNMKK